ncbi:arabinose operon regulatory protein [mine drainage metagenome]|uniref:Arabinose operon regulatory protein n=1 Tax=mine drainage metagenome TaxID=410659 RepID=A0A1J5Q1C7_9ZZZZ
MAQDDPIRESARFSFAPDFAGMELLTARYFAHRFTPHVHDTYAIALIEHGAERFRCARAEGIAPAGSIIVIPPGEVHTGQRGCESGWAYRVFYPQPQLLAALMAELRDGDAAAPVFGSIVLDDPALFMALRRLHAVLVGAADPLLRAGAWREAMGHLLMRHGGASQPRVGRETVAVRTAQELLRADEGAALTLDAVARAVGLSPWHFNRAFSSEVGLPPHAWRNQWRLAQAKTLLRRGQAPVEVAAALGYADQSHLHRHFKRAFGVTPGAYGKNVQDTRPQTR